MDKYVIISAIVAGIITWFFMYIDARLFDTPKSKFTYFKGIVFVSCLVAAVVYFMKPASAAATAMIVTAPQVGAGQMAMNGGRLAMDDMLTGLPPF